MLFMMPINRKCLFIEKMFDFNCKYFLFIIKNHKHFSSHMYIICQYIVVNVNMFTLTKY
jgi:hypothetical protein